MTTELNTYLHVPKPTGDEDTKKCVHCGFHHDNMYTTCAIPEAPFYALAYDPFFSNDDCANVTLVPADTPEQLKSILSFMKTKEGLRLIQGVTLEKMKIRLESTVKIDGARAIYNILPSWSDAAPPRWPADAIRLHFTWPSVYSPEDGGSFTHVHLVQFGPTETPEYDAGGYGYDKKGTVLAEWMMANLMKELRRQHKRAWIREVKTPETSRGYTDLYNPDGSLDYHDVQRQKYKINVINGLSAYYTGTVEKPRLKNIYLDGACGFETMVRLLESLGYKFIAIDKNNEEARLSETWALWKEADV